jgi:hypothetical protein
MNLSDAALKTLKNLIVPFVSFILILVLYFIFIGPYSTYAFSFPELKSKNELSIKILTTNLEIIQKASENKEKLQKLDTSLISLVPDSANASDLVGLIDKNANEYRLRTVDENRNVTNQENDKNRLIEVRFNGKAPGMGSSINFLKSMVTNNQKLIKISKLDLTNVPEELYTRISFNAFSIYSSPIPAYSTETPIENIFEDKKFIDLLNTF